MVDPTAVAGHTPGDVERGVKKERGTGGGGEGRRSKDEVVVRSYHSSGLTVVIDLITE